LLRRHVQRRADRGARSREALVPAALDTPAPEVEELDDLAVPVAGQEGIAGLEIAMDPSNDDRDSQ
jgi:hypothetical protein